MKREDLAVKMRLGIFSFLFVFIWGWISMCLKLLSYIGVVLFRVRSTLVDDVSSIVWGIGALVVIAILNARNKILTKFIWECSDELLKVAWPDKLWGLTLNVIVFSFISAVILMGFDFVLSGLFR